MSASEKPTVGKPAEKASTSLRRAVSYRGEEGATREARGVRGGRGLGARMHACIAHVGKLLGGEALFEVGELAPLALRVNLLRHLRSRFGVGVRVAMAVRAARPASRASRAVVARR